MKKSLLDAAAKTMHSCSKLNDPEAGLLLSDMLFRSFVLPASNRASKASDLLSFELPREVLDAAIKKSDSLLAQVLMAKRLTGEHENAMSIFEEATNDLDSFPPYSTQQMLEILVDVGQGHDAVEFFKSLDSRSRTPETFVLIANILETQGKWNAIGELYHLAKLEGCLSEELVIVALKGVERSKFDGKMKILRSIARDGAKLTGMEPREWLNFRYWTLSRSLGKHYTSLLMWWNEDRIRKAKEFELAITQFHERESGGLVPKNDILRALVYHCHNFDQLPNSVFSWDTIIPMTEEDNNHLLISAIAASKVTNLASSEKFLSKAIAALLFRGATEEAVHLLADSLSRGVLFDEGVIQTVVEEADKFNTPVHENILVARQQVES